jgi:hypothetical protein
VQSETDGQNALFEAALSKKGANHALAEAALSKKSRVPL